MAITNNTMVRNISEDKVRLLEKLSNLFQIKTTSGILVKLIPTHFEQEKAIKELKGLNRDLTRELSEARAELAKLKAELNTIFELEKRTREHKDKLIKSI